MISYKYVQIFDIILIYTNILCINIRKYMILYKYVQIYHIDIFKYMI